MPNNINNNENESTLSVSRFISEQENTARRIIEESINVWFNSTTSYPPSYTSPIKFYDYEKDEKTMNKTLEIYRDILINFEKRVKDFKIPLDLSIYLDKAYIKYLRKSKKDTDSKNYFIISGLNSNFNRELKTIIHKDNYYYYCENNRFATRHNLLDLVSNTRAFIPTDIFTETIHGLRQLYKVNIKFPFNRHMMVINKYHSNGIKTDGNKYDILIKDENNNAILLKDSIRIEGKNYRNESDKIKSFIKNLCKVKLIDYKLSSEIFLYNNLKKQMFESGELFDISEINFDYECKKDKQIRDVVEIRHKNGRTYKFIASDLEIIPINFENWFKGYNTLKDKKLIKNRIVKIINDRNIKLKKGTTVKYYNKLNDNYIVVIDKENNEHIINKKQIKVV